MFDLHDCKFVIKLRPFKWSCSLMSDYLIAVQYTKLNVDDYLILSLI